MHSFRFIGNTLSVYCFYIVLTDNIDSRKCIILSYQSYGQFQNYNQDEKNIASCMNTPTNVECLPDHGLPMHKLQVSEGYHFNNTQFDTFRVTFINNHFGQNLTGLSLRNAWEYEVDEYLVEKTKELAHQNVLLTYLLRHNAHFDVNKSNDLLKLSFVSVVCILAYLVYLSFVMKNGRQPRIILAVAIILINLAAITSGCGLLSYFGFKPTNDLFTIMPFVVMAIGADNMIVLVLCCDYGNTAQAKSVTTYIGRTLCQIGLSLRVNALCSIVGCLIGSLATNDYASSMAVYFAVVMTINWLLQETCFISILSLELRRQANDQCNKNCIFSKRQSTDNTVTVPQESCLDAVIRTRFIPLLTLRWWQVTIIIVYFAMLCVSLNQHFYMEVGDDMDQYLINQTSVKQFTYFNRNKSLSGPPVYFVVKGSIDYAINLNRVIIDTDYEWSIPNQIERYGWLSAKKSYSIPVTVNSWWNDFQMWRLTDGCCRLSVRSNKYCQPNGEKLKASLQQVAKCH